MEHNSNIKSMKLYNHVDRIYNELKELGKINSEFLFVEEITNFDQLHYCGTEAVDFSINKVGIDSSMSILEIGSGIGGPARYIANKTGATVMALELQSDQNSIALHLTERCGLSKKVKHVCGDFLTYDWEGKKFDVIVSWLALYHIFEHKILLQKCTSIFILTNCSAKSIRDVSVPLNVNPLISSPEYAKFELSIIIIFFFI